MKNFIRNLSVPLAIFITAAVILTGCGTSTTGNQQSAAQQTQGSAGASAFPLKVTDAKNTEVILEKKPQKIVSLTLGTDEMLFSLVEKSRIAGITDLSSDPGLSNILDVAKDFSVKLKSNAEKIIDIQPDLVFVADWADEKLVKQLRDAKVNVYAYKTPNGVDEQKKTITEIAKLVGEDKKGQELITWMDSRLKAVEDKLAAVPTDKKLTAISLDSFLYTYGKNTTFDDVATKAGLVNLGAKAGITGWQQVNKEKIIEMNPDVIFLPSWSYEGFDAAKFAQDFKKDKSLSSVKAIKNNMVFMLSEAHTTCISQNIVFGVEDMAKAAYPQLFK